MIGGNASAEGGGDEGGEDVAQSGCNIVIANRLQETSYDKTGFKDYIKVCRIQHNVHVGSVLLWPGSSTTNLDSMLTFRTGILPRNVRVVSWDSLTLTLYIMLIELTMHVHNSYLSGLMLLTH